MQKKTMNRYLYKYPFKSNSSSVTMTATAPVASVVVVSPWRPLMSSSIVPLVVVTISISVASRPIVVRIVTKNIYTIMSTIFWLIQGQKAMSVPHQVTKWHIWTPIKQIHIICLTKPYKLIPCAWQITKQQLGKEFWCTSKGNRNAITRQSNSWSRKFVHTPPNWCFWLDIWGEKCFVP